MKIKLFRGYELAYLEDQVNLFLEKHPDITDVKLNTSVNTPNHTYGASSEQLVTIMVLYQ